MVIKLEVVDYIESYVGSHQKSEDFSFRLRLSGPWRRPTPKPKKLPTTKPVISMPSVGVAPGHSHTKQTADGCGWVSTRGCRLTKF